jgi:hypothetical protein
MNWARNFHGDFIALQPLANRTMTLPDLRSGLDASPANVCHSNNAVAGAGVATVSLLIDPRSNEPKPLAQIGIFRTQLFCQGFAEPLVLFLELKKIRHLVHCRDGRRHR